MTAERAVGRPPRDESGTALLVVLVLLLAVAGSSSSLIWFMNQTQTRAGVRYRGAAAMALAEAGVHRTLAILESSAPDGSAGRTWWAQGYGQTSAAREMGTGGETDAGRFSIDAADGEDGTVLVTSTGEIAGVRRQIRARVVLASPALLAAIYGASTIRLEPRAETFILPYGAPFDGAARRGRPWVHIAAGRGLWFSTRGVAINEPSATLSDGAGPADGPVSPGPQTPAALHILLAQDADLITETDRRRTDLHRLRTLGAYVEGEVRRIKDFPAAPEVDRAYWRARAEASTANADLNRAAGEYLLDRALAEKTDSLYAPREFARLLEYLRAPGRSSALRGVVYVTGEVLLLPGDSLWIAEGSLVTDDSVRIDDRASLRITHTATTRALPGLIVLDPGRLTVGRGARLDAHGLVYAGRVFDIIHGARVRIVGSVIGVDPAISFNNMAATAVIRYDPAVLGTPGLRVPAGSPVVAWVTAWEERP